MKVPAFDVASVKLNKSGSGNMSIATHDDSFTATNVSLKSLLVNAYGIRDNLIVGVPGWAESARFDIAAKIVDLDLEEIKKLTQEQRRTMLATILVDRFGLKEHKETKILPVYDLLVLKNGPRFKESAVQSNDLDSKEADKHLPAGGMRVGNHEMQANAIPISSLAIMLSGQLNRSVIDKTGLTGRYDLALKWAPDQAAMGGSDSGQKPESGDSTPSLFTALQEQLGLKLQSTKGLVETLIIDHVDFPSGN